MSTARSAKALLPVAGMFVLIAPTLARSQGFTRDSGHCTRYGTAVLACWNFEAGSKMPQDFGAHPEFLPYLKGWDFRVSLPHVRFQLARSGAAAGPAIVGVVEDTTSLHDDTFQVTGYGHQNNSIWLFAVDGPAGHVFYKVIPSRRVGATGQVENVRSLTAGWYRIGGSTDRFRFEPPAATVVGKGRGAATIYLVARADDSALYMNRHLANSDTWAGDWEPLGFSSPLAPAITAAFDGKLALATWSGPSTSQIEVRIYDPTTDSWSGPAPAGLAAGVPPRLVWDGTALNVFFVRNDRLQHAQTTDAAAATFPPSVTVSETHLVIGNSYDVLAFNGRFHVVLRRRGGSPPQQVWYVASTVPYGQPSRWAAPSFTGLRSQRAPRIANFYEQLFAVGVDQSGQVVYARKDPNRPGNGITGTEGSDRWLDAGTVLDDRATGFYHGLATLTFNTDLYLAAARSDGGVSPTQIRIVNLSRAAMKRLLTDKWGAQLVWGGPGGRAVRGIGDFGTVDEVPAIGDVNGDSMLDLVRFTQRREPRVGPAPVYVALGMADGMFTADSLWHHFFSLAGEIPMVGDFDGDRRDDLITFTQQEQRDAAGNVIGPAPVWVATSTNTGTNPSRVWHRFFSLRGEIPMVGDFNGDGKDDIVTFTQRQQKDAAGNVIGPAPVWVALSDGTRFRRSRVWHTFFSLRGEIPMVGDFNGDGKDDIVTFTQQEQRDAAGNVIGQAPVWVALSDGTRFQRSRVWHTFFSLRGEVPQVGDFNLDGRDDIITFLAGQGSPGHERIVIVAHSTGSRFERSVTWHSDFVGSAQKRIMSGVVRSPLIGDFRSAATFDHPPAPGGRVNRFPRAFAFREDGAVHTVTSMGNLPFPSGVPWQRYKYFPEKALGVAQFPEFIFDDGPNHCKSEPYRFVLLGISGSATDNRTQSSVRGGGRAGHILQEFGHTLFANCFRPSTSDPFDLSDRIYSTSLQEEDFGALLIADNCVEDDSSDFYDCRSSDDRLAKAEHIFLGLMVNYRVSGDEYRARLFSEPNLLFRAQLIRAYEWLRENWFNGSEFKRGPSIDASLTQDGVQCLPGECS